MTIEDPVEYQHANRSSIIEQIEVGRDTPDFAVTLRSIMRQTPDVILVGEMRDAETMATALTAAETGHLVLSTLHTNDAIQAVSRILDSFPAANQPQIRQQISLALAAVIAQQLVPGLDGVSRWPATEIMIATDAVRALIRKGDDHQLRSPDFGRPRRRHDDHGAIAGRAGARQPHYAGDGAGALFPDGRIQPLFGLSPWHLWRTACGQSFEAALIKFAMQHGRVSKADARLRPWPHPLQPHEARRPARGEWGRFIFNCQRTRGAAGRNTPRAGPRNIVFW